MEWFGKLLGKLDESSVVVLDNAPYHNARTDESRNPTTSWKKGDIQTWLSKHNINFDQKMLKPELLEIAGRHKVLPVYQTDVLAASTNKDIKVLRLPVRHCELNPIELIQADLKGYIGRNNSTFKLEDVQKLFYDAKKTITRERWANAVRHVIENVEAHFSRVDCLDRPELEPLVISASGIDSDDEFDELDGISCSDEEGEDVCSEDPSGTLELLQSPADQAAMSGYSPEAMTVDGDDEILCGRCGLRDPSNGAGDATGWVCCDACDLWYHRFCEKVPEGELSGIFMCFSCKAKLHNK